MASVALRGALVLAVTALVTASAVVVGPAGEVDPEGAPVGAPSPARATEPLPDGDGLVAVIAPDKIQSIDEPRFRPAAAEEDLHPAEPVIAVEIRGRPRAYPVRILLWHEIVNDRIRGVPVAVTYCPLCNTGVVFRRPSVDGRTLEFGVSGQLLHSNLVMYDRQTESLWPQVTGRAIRGPLEGTRLELLPSQMLSFEDWRAAHPLGRVLRPPEDAFVAPKVAAPPPYGANPYHGYDRKGAAPALGGDPDPRLPAKERVLGVVVRGRAFAFPYSALRRRAEGDWSVARARVGGRTVVVFWKAGTVSAVDAPTIEDSRDVGAVAAFVPVAEDQRLRFDAGPGGIVDRATGSRFDLLGRAVEGPLSGARLTPVVATDSFWFDWAAFYPETDIYRN